MPLLKITGETAQWTEWLGNTLPPYIADAVMAHSGALDDGRDRTRNWNC